MSIYGSEEGEIATDEEEEKEEEGKKIIFKRIWPNFGKKPRKAMFQSIAFDVYYLFRVNGKVQFGIQNENAKRILCKKYMEDRE